MVFVLQQITGDNVPAFGAYVDVSALQGIADVCRRHDAWTWNDDNSWFKQVCFVQGPLEVRTEPSFGWLFSIDMIHLLNREARRGKPGPVWRTKLAIRRYIRGSQRDVT